MAPAVSSHAHRSMPPLTWRPTKIMNMHDLSMDDDFLSHLLVEKLGTGTVPLLVHKMDSSRRLPKTDAQDLLHIVRRLVVTKGPVQHATRQAVDDLLLLPAIRYYLKSYTQKQINAFATHASRYFELYHPSGCIEIAHTSRYSHRTGKSELCILATRFLSPGTVITELKGSMANLTDEEDKELKRTDLRNSDIRRDFSVIHSKQMKKNHLFLGPARFVNHDCDNNCELFREGRYITFRVLRPIAIGEEITAHYGDGYFGKRNRHCLCETCEKRGRGGYSLDHNDEPGNTGSLSGSDSDPDSDSDTSSSEPEDEAPNPSHLNERRTRRGVYAVMAKKEDESDESEDEGDSVVPLADASDILGDGEIELIAEVGTSSELTSLPPSRSLSIPSNAGASSSSDGPSRSAPQISRYSSSLSSLSSHGDQPTPDALPTSFRSIISTRRQAAQKEALLGEKPPESQQPPISSSSTASPSSRSSSRRVSRWTNALSDPFSNKGQRNLKEFSATPSNAGNVSRASTKEVEIKQEETEPRVLRTRPSVTSNLAEAPKDTPAAHDVPRGPDGKPLPTCNTCFNVLPVISVDHKVVWGLAFDSPSKKKKVKQDCPRCIRHFAIYAQPWPCRISSNGSAFVPTPREESTPVDAVSRRITSKTLPVIDRRLLAAAKAVSHKPRHQSEADNSRPAKRQKTEAVSSQPPTRNPTVAGESSTSDMSISRSQGEKRKRGRPRRSSPTPKSTSEDTSVQPQSDGTKSQPRNTNGRFEKKNSSPGKKVPAIGPPTLTRAERALERGKIRSMLEQQEKGDDGEETGDRSLRASFRSRKRMMDEGDDTERPLPPFQKFQPRPSNFKGGRLFSNPNPMRFAAQAWASAGILDESSSEDEKAPVTPEDILSPPATIVEPEAEDSAMETMRPPAYLPVAPAVIRGALTFKPSPFNFARRRWGPSSMSPVDAEDANPPEDEEREAKRPRITQDAPKSPASPSGAQRLSSLGGSKERNPWTKVLTVDRPAKLGLAVSGTSSIMTLMGASGAPTSLDSDDSDGSSILRQVFPTLSSAKFSDSPIIRPAGSSSPHLVHAKWDTLSEVSDL